MSATVPGAPGSGESALVWDPVSQGWVPIALDEISTATSNVAYFGGSESNSATLPGVNSFASGRSGSDTLIGGDGNDVLVGGALPDRLEGGAGDDTLIGGLATVTGSLETGIFTIQAEDDATAVDTLIGGLGNDTYIVTSSLDQIIEEPGGGIDRVLLTGSFSGTHAYALTAPNVEAIGLLDPATTQGYDISVATSLAGGVSISGGAGNDTLTGGSGDDTISGLAGNNLLNGGDGNDSFILGPGDNTVVGGAGQDTVAFETAGTYTVTGAEGSWTINGAGGNATVSGVEFLRTNSTDVILGSGEFYVCFAGGTRILTAEGEVEVERLQAGDLVATVGGRGAPMKPVLWIGHRRVVLAGHPKADDLAPVRIRAGALGEKVPHRDLLVSPDHCLFLDGALVPARLLVNGTSIVAERGLAEVTWYHVELESHDVLLAEGAAAESWLDCGNRSWFENARIALMAVSGSLESAGTGWDSDRACAPVLHGGPRLAAIRQAIARRAPAPPTSLDSGRRNSVA